MMWRNKEYKMGRDLPLGSLAISGSRVGGSYHDCLIMLERKNWCPGFLWRACREKLASIGKPCGGGAYSDCSVFKNIIKEEKEKLIKEYLINLKNNEKRI